MTEQATAAPAASADTAIATPAAEATVTTALETPSLLSEGTATPETTETADPAKTEGDTATKEGEAEKPIEYDLKLPEGQQPDETLMGEFKDLAKELKLPQEAAQALFDKGLKAIEKAGSEATNLWNETNKAWTKQVQDDAEIGGKNLDVVKSNFNKVINELFDKPAATKLFAALDMTGAGNNPEIVRAFHRLTSRLVEGGPISGGVSKQPKSAAAILYPNQSSQ